MERLLNSFKCSLILVKSFEDTFNLHRLQVIIYNHANYDITVTTVKANFNIAPII